MSTKRDKYLAGLRRIFSETTDKHEANRKAEDLLAEMSGDQAFLSEILSSHISDPKNLNTLFYPVIAIEIDLNEYFGLVANCWIPLPDRTTELSTKSIHHHGDMLLSTATAFGPGYEHWTFKTPSIVDKDKEIYDLEPLEQSHHGLNHVAFVEEYTAHLPLYPNDLTVTFALWSSRFPTTWKERIKRAPLIRQNSERLKKLAVKFGLANQLELKVVEYFDFYPTAEGFKGIRVREEFPRTTNKDYLQNLFYIVQRTGNDRLSSTIRATLNKDSLIDNRSLVESLLNDLESGDQIDPILTPIHFQMERANFLKSEINSVISAQTGRTSNFQ